jgi:hypothetical protein
MALRKYFQVTKEGKKPKIFEKNSSKKYENKIKTTVALRIYYCNCQSSTNTGIDLLSFAYRLIWLGSLDIVAHIIIIFLEYSIKFCRLFIIF